MTSKSLSTRRPDVRMSSGSAQNLWKSALFLIVLAALPLSAHPPREKDALQYGAGLIVNIPFPEAEVEQVVQDVVQNGIIRGTKEYNKDEYVSGATPASSTHVFSDPATPSEKVFYKVRLRAIDPRNFKNGGDVGTLAVRYVLQPQGAKNTVLRIDARFVEDFRKTSHPSNGSVESAEYKDIHDRLDAIESMRAQTVEAEKEKQEQLAKRQNPDPAGDSPASSSSAPSNSESSQQVSANPVSSGTAPANQVQSEASTPDTASAPSPSSGQPDLRDSAASPGVSAPAGQTLEEHVHDLKQQVERLVKSPGAPLKSAPFHSASTLQTLPTGTDVLIVISTPYWLGVETHDGQHGWILRDQLEQSQ